MTKNEVIKLLERAVAEARGQNRLAKRWGVSQGTISDILRGRREPGRRILGKLGLVLDYKPKKEAKDEE